MNRKKQEEYFFIFPEFLQVPVELFLASLKQNK